MAMMLKNDDLVEFVVKASGHSYKARVLQPCRQYPYYEVEIISTSRTDIKGEIMVSEIGEVIKIATNESSSNPISFINIMNFEDDLAEWNAHKSLELCHLAVNLNNKDWFEECHAQYALWNSKVVQA